MTGPQQYQVQFSTVEEHARLVERAKALLARSNPGMTLGELHLEAMKLLVASLERRKFAVTDRPRPRRQRGDDNSESSATRRRGVEKDQTTTTRRPGEVDAPTRQPSRYIPAAERREVYQRDGGRCTYVDVRGERCCEMRYLELHHKQPFARHGSHVASNITLRCAAHNALAAEEDFGPELIAERRAATAHEALARQQPTDLRHER